MWCHNSLSICKDIHNIMKRHESKWFTLLQSSAQLFIKNATPIIMNHMHEVQLYSDFLKQYRTLHCICKSCGIADMNCSINMKQRCI